MPNWVTTRITFTGNEEKLKEFFPRFIEKITINVDGDDYISISPLIPMPESLNIESGSRTEDAIFAYLTDGHTVEVKDLPKDKKRLVDKYITNSFCESTEEWHRRLKDRYLENIAEDPSKREELISMGERYLYNIENYGFPTWYEWRIANWGTKWDITHQYIDEDAYSIEFDTAWSAPGQFVEAIIKLLLDEPGIEIEGLYCDEDYMGWNAGRFNSSEGILVVHEVESDRDCMEIAHDLWGYEFDDDGQLIWD